jgi:hypothetical protein
VIYSRHRRAHGNGKEFGRLDCRGGETVPTTAEEDGGSNEDTQVNDKACTGFQIEGRIVKSSESERGVVGAAYRE